jgi:hypothetical protein
MTKAPSHNLERFFSGTTDEKLHAMEKLYSQHQKQLLTNETITDSLAILKEYGAALSGQMKAMHMDSLCCSCAEQAGGGCCSSYMEANSDVLLLLMNRLQGTTVGRQHSSTQECCFLGNSGCILPIKPMFCLNYNCSHIHARATAKEMQDLEYLAGKILTEQTRLETILLQKL